mmetsp:Transcript_8576/g.30933  ORF Transcript_8576/g.30933 Transcript_8576/m.30933 type:complete len:251 (-) Transcript_8576:123-875(-)
MDSTKDIEGAPESPRTLGLRTWRKKAEAQARLASSPKKSRRRRERPSSPRVAVRGAATGSCSSARSESRALSRARSSSPPASASARHPASSSCDARWPASGSAPTSSQASGTGRGPGPTSGSRARSRNSFRPPPRSLASSFHSPSKKARLALDSTSSRADCPRWVRASISPSVPTSSRARSTSVPASSPLLRRSISSFAIWRGSAPGFRLEASTLSTRAANPVSGGALVLDRLRITRGERGCGAWEPCSS